MKKAVRVTVKKMQRIFVRNKSREPDDENSTRANNIEGNGIERGLEAREDKLDEVFHSVSAETLSRTKFYVSSDEEDNYIVDLPDDNCENSKVTNNENGGVSINTDQGASANVSTTVMCQNAGYCGSVVHAQTRHLVAHNMFGDLETKCAALPIDLLSKISDIKGTLLFKYPPYYDFCVISSDADYEEALRFKDYVSSSFGLAGCTLYDGFISLGADLFDNYALMMNQSSKVFFFVTQTFTRSEFCRRLQNGAVFDVLMSKIKHEREKCVPVFINRFGRAPLALSGIAGLNWSQEDAQRDVMRRSLNNTYTSHIRQRRFIMDSENYQKRCIEFEKEVSKYIADYQSNISCQTSISDNNISIDVHDHNNREELLSNINQICAGDTLPSTAASSSENYSTNSAPIAISTFSSKSEDPKQDTNETLTNPEMQSNPRKSNLKSQESPKSSKKGSCGSPEKDRQNQHHQDKIKKALENDKEENSVAYFQNCENVHYGTAIHIVINQMPGEDATDIQDTLKNSIFDLVNKKADSDSETGD